MRTRIKICGLRTLEAVRTCVQSGADAVGFVFYPPSPRAVTPFEAKPLASSLGPWVTPVALFVNPTVTEVSEVLDAIPNALLQFHADEPPEFCAQFDQPFMKAIRMKEGVDLRFELDRFHKAQGVLVDSWSEHFGGSGHTFDWSLLSEVAGCGMPLILSGGLSDGNVAEAIKQVKPYGVDVSSGVESHRGVKSLEKIVSFCKAVHVADSKTLF